MKKLLYLFAVVLLASCSSSKSKPWTIERAEKEFSVKMANPVIIATRAKNPIKLDGVLSEEEWKDVWAYEMEAVSNPEVYNPPKRRQTMEATPFQGGQVKVTYDNSTLYVGVAVKDTDVVQHAKQDQGHHYQTGDIIEVFLKSKKRPEHWEIYGAPNGLRTTMKQIGYGAYGNDILEFFRDDMKIGVTVQGTLNNYNDIDEGYAIEFAIPFKMLEDITGVKVDNAGEWTIMVSRYNFLVNSDKQFSCCPRQPKVNYHLKEYYADLVFE